MNLKYEIRNRDMFLKVSGSLDAWTSADLLKVFNRTQEQYGCDNIQLDFSDLQEINSFGFRTLLMMKRKIAGSFVIKEGDNKEILAILKMTGFNDLLRS